MDAKLAEKLDYIKEQLGEENYNLFITGQLHPKEPPIIKTEERHASARDEDIESELNRMLEEP